MTELPSTTALDLERDGAWLTIWMSQPKSRNALSAEMTADLMAVFGMLRAKTDIRGVTLRGRGGVFCAGGDLKMFRAELLRPEARDNVIELSRNAAALFDALDALPQPVIAIVEGAAMAGGFGLACCADIIIADDDAQFALTETRIGLSPAQIAPFVIRRIGVPAARRLILTAARFGAQEAVRIGLADCATAASGIEEVEAGIRKQVLSCAPGALAATKALLRDLPGMDRQGQIAAAAENFASLMTAPEAAEGVSAFLEKRKPAWAQED